MKWMKLAFLAGLSLSLWGTTTAQAAKRTVLPKYPRQRLFTFKTQRTRCTAIRERRMPVARCWALIRARKSSGRLIRS